MIEIHEVRPVSRALSASLLCVGILAAPLPPATAAKGSTFYVDYTEEPDQTQMMVHDLAIVSAGAKFDRAAVKRSGTRVLAYLSVVEFRESSEAGSLARQLGVPAVGANDEWGSLIADIGHPTWSQLLIEKLAPAIVARGFDGFFLDTADSIARLNERQPSRQEEFRRSLIGLVNTLREKFPDEEIIMNRGFDILDQVRQSVDGILIESVFHSFDPSTGGYRQTPPAETGSLVTKVGALRERGMPVYILDYLPPYQLELAAETATRIEGLGAAALLATPALDGTVLAPCREIPRRVLVLYGWDQAERRPIWPVDTMAAERLQMPLEWMGYECEYLNVAEQMPPEDIAGAYAGVIFDAEIEIPYRAEMRFAKWAVRQKERGAKVLFTGTVPFVSDDARALLARGFGMRGSLEPVHQADAVEIVQIDPSMMNFEAQVHPHRTRFIDARAPSGARVYLKLRCSEDRRTIADFDPVYTANWGGVVFDPYASFSASPSHTLSLFDPFAFLAEIWPRGSFPAPDPTTREGSRVLVSHIDGDGFASLSETKRDKTCAEVIRDRILTRYAIPVTVSVVEANTRAAERILDPDRRESYEDIARSIFALPNVEAASHTYSHPYVWIPGDPDGQGLYETENLVLHEAEAYPKIDYRREIAGSVEYIEHHLLPPGKKVEMLLWSGNCRPPAEAIRIVRELGIENMNGGDTIASRRYPCLAAVSPRTMPWGDELQVYAPNQNEYVYTHDWRGPFYGGFASVIDTFERTGHPRRLKPVNIYYHFYSAANLGALRALEKVHQWALGQPLFAMTASEFARSTRDSRATRVFQRDPRRWTIVNGGHLRTLRLPQTSGLPNLAQSRGVTGFCKGGDGLYIHTDGSGMVELSLGDGGERPPHLHLTKSSAPITFSKLTPTAVEFHLAGLRPAVVTLGGAAPGSKWSLTIGDEKSTAGADADGYITLELPGAARVVLGQAPIASR